MGLRGWRVIVCEARMHTRCGGGWQGCYWCHTPTTAAVLLLLLRTVGRRERRRVVARKRPRLDDRQSEAPLLPVEALVGGLQAEPAAAARAPPPLVEGQAQLH